MSVYCALRNDQLARDLAVGKTTGEQGGDLPLALRKL